MTLEERFCNECPFLEDMGGVSDYCGSPAHEEYLTCTSDLDPEDPGCPRREEFIEQLDEEEQEEL